MGFPYGWISVVCWIWLSPVAALTFASTSGMKGRLDPHYSYATVEYAIEPTARGHLSLLVLVGMK